MTCEQEHRTVRVLVVDDQAVVRRGIRAYLDVLGGVEVVAEAADGLEALSKLRSMAEENALPDVILLDLLMPNMDGVTATGKITQRYPHIRVVVLTGFGQMARVNAALSQGASAYLLKDAEPAQVVAAIRTAVGTRPTTT
jgi:DNA-binding NarL/FixJ family response regulator